jgi:hypothetical protein
MLIPSSVVSLFSGGEYLTYFLSRKDDQNHVGCFPGDITAGEDNDGREYVHCFCDDVVRR